MCALPSPPSPPHNERCNALIGPSLSLFFTSPRIKRRTIHYACLCFLLHAQPPAQTRREKFHAGQEESFLIGAGRGSLSYFLLRRHSAGLLKSFGAEGRENISPTAPLWRRDKRTTCHVGHFGPQKDKHLRGGGGKFSAFSVGESSPGALACSPASTEWLIVIFCQWKAASNISRNDRRQQQLATQRFAHVVHFTAKNMPSSGFQQRRRLKGRRVRGTLPAAMTA